MVMLVINMPIKVYKSNINAIKNNDLVIITQNCKLQCLQVDMFDGGGGERNRTVSIWGQVTKITLSYFPKSFPSPFCK